MNLALLGGVKDTPLSVPEDGEQLVAVMGGVDLDLSHVQLPETLHLSALAIMGGIKLIVPRGTDVVLKGFAFMGGRRFRRRAEWQREDIRSVIYLNAVAVMGGIEVVEAD
jgi:predicted membrane protein